MDFYKLSILLFSSIFVISACSTQKITSQSVGEGIGMSLIIGGLTTFPKKEDENKNDYDSDKKQSYGLIAGGIATYYLMSYLKKANEKREKNITEKLKKYINIKYSLVKGNSNFKGVVRDIFDKEGLLTASIFSTVINNGYVKYTDLKIIPVIQSSYSKPTIVKFTTYAVYDVNATNSLFKYTPSGNQNVVKTFISNRTVKVPAKGKIKSDVIDLSKIAIQEKINTFITDVNIRRKLRKIYHKIHVVKVDN